MDKLELRRRGIQKHAAVICYAIFDNKSPLALQSISDKCGIDESRVNRIINIHYPELFVKIRAGRKNIYDLTELGAELGQALAKNQTLNLYRFFFNITTKRCKW